jgi:hypothetical protein
MAPYLLREVGNMTKSIKGFFGDADNFGTVEVAAFAGISESRARAYAAEQEIPRIGQAYVWSRADVEELLDALDSEDDDSDEPGGDDADDDADDDDSDEDDEDE